MEVPRVAQTTLALNGVVQALSWEGPWAVPALSNAALAAFALAILSWT
jgi:hypothetical protein